MANNPFVDGITNLAIPDSPHGVSIAKRKGLFSLYGIESKIGDVADLSGVHVDYVFLNGMTVEKILYLNKMVVGNFANFYELHCLKDIYMTGAKFKKLSAGGLAVDGTLYIDNLVVASYDGGKIAARRVSGIPKRIPESLQMALFSAESLYKSMQTTKAAKEAAAAPA